MTERVLIPKTERSVRYHTLDCGHVERRQGYELNRHDAEDVLGRKPAKCVKRREAGEDGPDAEPPEVSA